MKDQYYEYKKIEFQKFAEELFDGCEFLECEFENCTFEECTVQNCRFTDCKFYHCTIISLSAKHTEVKRAEFDKCNLIGVHWNELLPAGRICEPIHKLKNCCFKYSSFVDMNFKRFDFSGNSILESAFETCDLTESSFQDCRLNATQFIKNDLRGANFRGAAGYQIDIITNKISDAKFSFPEAINLLNGLGIMIE